MKRLVSLCGAFSALAMIIPSLATLTYQKSAPDLTPVTEKPVIDVVSEADAYVQDEETKAQTELSAVLDCETVSYLRKYDNIYRMTPADRYMLVYSDSGIEAYEDENRALDAVPAENDTLDPIEDPESDLPAFVKLLLIKAAEETAETEAEETTAPETKAPETKAPETKAPETKAPETKAPETKAPETKAPETKAPETKAPETKAPETKAPETKAPETEAPETDPEPEMPKNTSGYVGCDAKTIRVYNKNTGKYMTMLMGDYLVNVIAAEMPVRFELEALKAQAIASRTFAIYKSQSSSYYHSSQHGKSGADVCTNSGHCQSYLDYETWLKNWPDKKYADSVYAKIKQAVIETSGVVATYDGKPIEAVFHATSYGKTDSMENVWGGGVPYLVGVDTPETLETGNVCSTKKMKSSELKKIFLSKNSKATFSSNPAEWISYTKNENGRVETMTIGGASIKGTTAKGAFGLRSTRFKTTYDADTDTFTFYVYGWGHGVGMSQYGAGIYADQGKSCEFIIKHYYQGVKLVVWDK